MKRIAGSLLCAALVAAGCHSSTSSTSSTATGGDAAQQAVTTALDKRFAAITDFALSGTAQQGSEKLPYDYEMKQPTFVRAAVGPHVIVFDGKAMLVLDEEQKTAERRDFGGMPDEMKLMMLHQAFSRFACEGWRPPLLRPSGFAVAEAGGTWTITVPIDDATLKEQRLVLKAPGAEFVEKSIVDKSGKAVTSTKVTSELTDPATHLVFPKSWESRDADGNVLAIALDKAAVNAGLPVDRFKTDVPAGYKTP